jgi:hypothetical protein
MIMLKNILFEQIDDQKWEQVVQDAKAFRKEFPLGNGVPESSKTPYTLQMRENLALYQAGIGNDPTVDPVHAENSDHYNNRAIDIPCTGVLGDRVSTWWKNRGYSTFWKVPNHFNHVHVYGGALGSSKAIKTTGKKTTSVGKKTNNLGNPTSYVDFAALQTRAHKYLVDIAADPTTKFSKYKTFLDDNENAAANYFDDEWDTTFANKFKTIPGDNPEVANALKFNQNYLNRLQKWMSTFIREKRKDTIKYELKQPIADKWGTILGWQTYDKKLTFDGDF